MSSLKDLINFAVTGDATNLKTAFSELMADKIVDRIDNFKPQVAADMFNIAPEVQEEGKKTDHDEDGDNDFADIQIARMKASGMKKSAAVAMTKDKPYNEEVEELDEISRKLATAYLQKTNPDYSTPEENKKRDPGRKLALGKKWGQALGVNVPKVSATEETKYVDEARRPGRPSKKSDSAEDNDDPEDNPPFLNQLHKAKQLNRVPDAKESHYSIAFANGPQAKISASHAHDAIMMIDNQRTTAQKDDMTKNLSKSHDSFKQLIGAK